MVVRIRVVLWLAIVCLCLLCGAITACGATTTAVDGAVGGAPGGAGQGLTLHVVRIRPGETRPSLDTYVDDSAAVQHLYAAALQLPVVPSGVVLNCGPDNSVVHHLTFMGGTVTQRQMDLDAAGCRLLVFGQQAYWTDKTFIGPVHADRWHHGPRSDPRTRACGIGVSYEVQCPSQPCGPWRHEGGRRRHSFWVVR